MSNYLDPEKKTIKLERKKKDTFLILHDAVTPLTTLLVSEIKIDCPDTAIKGLRCLARRSVDEITLNNIKIGKMFN